MAKQIGLLIKGRIDGFSFYHDRLHGHLVRRTGGVTSKQYHKDQRYAAARDASAEFALVSGTGKLIRNAFGDFASQVKDGSMVNRLNKELLALKQLDNKNPRGKRTPETRITDTNSNQYFRIFQFNEAVKTYELTSRFPTINKKGNTLFMKDLQLLPSAFPEGATHAGLTMIRTVIDFEKKEFKTSSSQMTLVSKENKEEVSLHINGLPLSSGTEITCLQVLFFRELNGDLIQLKDKVHSMGIIEVTHRQVSKVRKLKTTKFRCKTQFRPDIRFIPGRITDKKEPLPKNHPT